jgi:hypothetical protein
MGTSVPTQKRHLGLRSRLWEIYRREKGGAVLEMPLCLIKDDFPCVGIQLGADGTLDDNLPEKAQFAAYFESKMTAARAEDVIWVVRVL